MTAEDIARLHTVLEAKGYCPDCHVRQAVPGLELCAECDRKAEQWRDADEWMTDGDD